MDPRFNVFNLELLIILKYDYFLRIISFLFLIILNDLLYKLNVQPF